MKNFNALLTAAIIGWVGVSAGTAHAGNYRPINRDADASQAAPREVGSRSISQKSANSTPAGSKTAYCFDACYTVPLCSGAICSPVTQCSSYCSPCGPRPYFPASNWGYGNGYGNGYYGGYGNYGGYGYGGYGGYGSYYGGLGGYGNGWGNGLGGNGWGGYGGYYSPSYVSPLNPGLGSPYVAPVINSPVVNPYVAPVGGYGNSGYFPSGLNGSYGPVINPASQPGFSSPIISQPLQANPVYNSPFYP